ncbi:MAG: hypothetical protein R2720_07345 [Candidatus Nanopelagicales bacterium]
MTDERDAHLRLASSRLMAVLPGGLGDFDDPGDEPLAPGTPRPALISISVRRSGGRVTASTSLAMAGMVLSGSATREDADRERTIALATLDALRPIVPEGVDIESAQIVAIPGRKVALTVVGFPDDTGQFEALVGSALVRGDTEDALARSVLSALNRRLSS